MKTSDFAERLDAFIEEEVARRRDAEVPTISVSEAARLLSVSDSTLRRRIAEGTVEAVTVLGSLRIRPSEIDRIRARR